MLMIKRHQTYLVDLLAISSTKSHPSLTATIPLISHMSGTEEVAGLVKFPLHPLHSSTACHAVHYSLFSRPFLISQQEVCIKVSAVN
jgi:hypothetical protein